ncbi:hypothetical protein BJY00DRAFT_43432 [Aspergillus carlsbadensis]|nr:hypothetical protein BJY00DRAFT_43432 [Aspergillus carlsbadensis]
MLSETQHLPGGFRWIPLQNSSKSLKRTSAQVNIEIVCKLIVRRCTQATNAGASDWRKIIVSVDQCSRWEHQPEDPYSCSTLQSSRYLLIKEFPDPYRVPGISCMILSSQSDCIISSRHDFRRKLPDLPNVIYRGIQPELRPTWNPLSRVSFRQTLFFCLFIRRLSFSLFVLTPVAPSPSSSIRPYIRQSQIHLALISTLRPGLLQISSTSPNSPT